MEALKAAMMINLISGEASIRRAVIELWRDPQNLRNLLE